MRCFALIPLILAPAVAWAGDALKVDLVPKAQQGQGQPELVVKAQAELSKLSIDLKRSTDGKRVRKTVGPISAGRSHTFTLPMNRPGAATFSGSLKVEVAGGQSGSMPLNLEVALLPELELSVGKGDIDLKKRRVRIHADRDLVKVQVSLMSDTGTPMGTTEAEASGTETVVEYEQRKGTVMRISIKGWDEDGFYGGVDLFPWQVDIPHEEVNFASGKSVIEKSEAPKLEKSFEEIEDAIKRYGKLATIKLFIAGHTDTVSAAAYNRQLSNDRARALGRWFKKRGVRIPIRYAGFGETMLLVKTPDNTDEPRNRRAEYIVAVDPPPMEGGARWKPLD